MTLSAYYRKAAIPKPVPRLIAKKRQEKLDAKNERAARTITRKRDAGKCRIPGCRDAARHLHHIVFRSQSKAARWRTSNLVWLCPEHHQMVHHRLIEISGDADRGELVITGDVNVLRFRL